MSVEEVLEKTTIAFPRTVSALEVEKLFTHIAEQLPGEVNYQTTSRKRVGNRFEDSRIPYESVIRSVEVSGMVNSARAFSAFRCERPRENPSQHRDMSLDDQLTYFSGIKFDHITDYSLEEHRKEEKHLWDQVRELVGKYFTDNPF